MKKFLIFSLIFFFIVLALPMVESWGPHTHRLLAQRILDDQTTQIGKLCGSTEENRQAYLLGCFAPDLTVIYYFEEGGKEYRLSHNFLFQQELMGQAKSADEQCFSWGVAAHLVQDSIAHTQVVPSAIDSYYIPNWLLHPLLEKKYDSAIALKYPEIVDKTHHAMDALDGPKGDRYVEMIDLAMGINSQINVKNELKKLQIAISGEGFYSSQFRPSGNVWMFESYNYIDKLTNFLAPYIGTVNFGSIDYYFEKSGEQTVNIFNNWGARYQISPHGFEELSKANEKTGSSLTVIFILAFSIPIIIFFITKKKRYLLLIPILLLGTIVVIYTLL